MNAPNKSPAKLPPRILIYGTPKIGKSTFGEKADKPVFIPTEDGLDALDVPQFDKATTFAQVLANLLWLAENEHDYNSVVTDSLDHLEPMIWKQICDESNVTSIELANGGYGKGYVAALNLWREFFDAVNYLRQTKGMTVINICHAQIKRFESPTTDAFDRYELKLHKAAAALAVELSDVILFVNYYVGIKKEADSAKQKDDDKRKRGVGSGERIIFTEERPAFIAGNRYDLPAEIPFDKDGSYWGVIAQHVPFFSQKVETADVQESESPKEKKKK